MGISYFCKRIMKRFFTILIMFAVLAGAVSKEVYSSKILKTIVLSENSDPDDKDSDKDESKDKIEKEAIDVSFCHSHDFTFATITSLTAYTFFISQEISISSPYLERISQPPEARA